MITFLANLVIPLFIFTLVLYGTLKRKDIYTPFLEGVMDGFKIVLEIAPTLIALFFAIQIFRSSGALDLIVRFLTPVGSLLKIPQEVLPVSDNEVCTARIPLHIPASSELCLLHLHKLLRFRPVCHLL